MTESVFDSYLETRARSMADAQVKSGKWALEEAFEKAKAELQKRLPKGLATPENHLFSIIDDGLQVGSVWFAISHEGPIPFAAIMDFSIRDEFQHKGHGPRAVKALEDKVLGIGLYSIFIYLGGDNRAALALCRKCGYPIMGTFLMKKVTGPKLRGAVSFRPMAMDAFRAYIEDQIRRRAKTQARQLNCPLPDALKHARADFQEILDGGPVSEENRFCAIVDDSTGKEVGIIQFGVHVEAPGAIAFIEDFEIHEEFRRKGYGTQALTALENWVRESNGYAVSLFVQGFNEPALALYRKSGYETTGTEFMKPLTNAAR
jgi:ribosomal protein S18 acetylase RimI-like enzyme